MEKEKRRKVKYPKLGGKCITCLGCNLLAQANFSGVDNCEGYVPANSHKELK